jgi:peptidoglycan hydrolase CwlO-like protein
MDMQEEIREIHNKLDRIDLKLDSYLERITKVEEHSKTNRGALTILYSTIMTVGGWVLYKLL